MPRRQRQYQRQSSYQAPGNFEYQSAFNPIPIDFIQEQFNRRQSAYDVAFAGSIAAKEQMAAQDAALQDLGAKNQIIGDTMSNIDKTVEEKYGGDWGRAAKEIASMVSSARQNPFWETTKHLKSQQELQQKYQLEHPDAHIYQDVLGQTTVDPETGKVRGREAITFRGGAKGDWATSVAKQFSGMKGDRLVSVLKSIGIEGYAGIKSIEELSDDDLQAFASNPAVVETFKENNPDFYKSKSEIEGLTDAQIDAEAANYIYGQVAPRAYKTEALQAVKDQAYFERMKVRAGAQSGIITSNSAEFVDVSLDDPKTAARELRQAKEQIADMPDGPKKEQMQKQYDQDVKAREFVIHNTQNSRYAVDIDSYYDKYVKTVGDKAISREQFEENIMIATREGELPGVEDIDTDLPENLWGSNAGITYSNEARQAGRELRRAMKKFRNGDGAVAMNVNVIGGELGTKDQDTYVGRLNNLVTDEWNESMTSFTVPYSNRQIGDILKNDKRYNGKGRKNEPRDSKKDKVRMTDGYMNGKPVYQVTFYDKNGSELGSEYVSPGDTSATSGNMQNAAVEMMQSGDPQKTEIGQRILVNSVYSPAIQTADIHNNAEGTFRGVRHDGNEVKFEKTPQGTYLLYTMVDGKKDYFQKEDSEGNIVNFEPTNEAEIKRILLAAEGL